MRSFLERGQVYDLRLTGNIDIEGSSLRYLAESNHSETDLQFDSAGPHIF